MAGGGKRTAFFFFHWSSALLSLGVFLYSLVVIFGDLDFAFYSQQLPSEILYTTATLSGVSVFVSLCAIISVKKENICLFFIYFLFAVAAFVAYGYIIVNLIVEGLSVEGLDYLPGSEDSSDSFSSRLAENAFDKSGFYRRLQNELRCCGVDMESAYDDEAYPAIFNGDECTEVDDTLGSTGIDEIDIIRAQFPSYNATVQELADSNAILQKETFFCINKIRDRAEKVLIVVFAFLGAVGFMQGFCFLFTIHVLFCMAEPGQQKGRSESATMARRKKKAALRYSHRVGPKTGVRDVGEWLSDLKAQKKEEEAMDERAKAFEKSVRQAKAKAEAQAQAQAQEQFSQQNENPRPLPPLPDRSATPTEAPPSVPASPSPSIESFGVVSRDSDTRALRDEFARSSSQRISISIRNSVLRSSTDMANRFSRRVSNALFRSARTRQSVVSGSDADDEDIDPANVSF